MAKSPGTIRWERWRDRQPKGEIIVDVPVDHALIDLMLDTGTIDERSSRDRKKLAEVILRLTANALAPSLSARRRTADAGQNAAQGRLF
ncbi:hypothetical protein HB777_24215 [Mesorhizobium loti]|nr:hypothetical protein HB777_24215 [Mesorhizobium loti]